MSDSSKTFQKTINKTIGLVKHLSMHHFWRFAKEQGFSMAQMITLRHVFNQGATKGCSISAISDRLEITNAAVSQSLDKLVDQGLVERQENPKDRRSKQILLTPKGEEILKESMQAKQAWLDNLAAQLTPEEQTQIEAAFRLLTEKITEMEKS